MLHPVHQKNAEKMRPANPANLFLLKSNQLIHLLLLSGTTFAPKNNKDLFILPAHSVFHAVTSVHRVHYDMRETLILTQAESVVLC